MNVNKTKADYKRIIENNFNLNTPRTPDLLKYNDITRGLQADNFERTFGFAFGIAPINANEYAILHKRKEPARGQ